MNLRHTSGRIIVLSAMLVPMAPAELDPNLIGPNSTGITQGPDGPQFNFNVKLEPGIYTIEYSDDMLNWNTMTVEASDGFPIELQEKISQSARYYRVDLDSAENAPYSSGELFSELLDQVTLASLKSIFSFPDSTTKPGSLDLSDPARLSYDERIYASAILLLSRYASEQAALLPAIYPEYAADIVASIVLDMGDGVIDGDIPIGTSGVTTQAYSNLQWLVAFSGVQQEVAGFRNVVLKDEEGLTFSLPGYWDCFHWDSASWQ